MIIKALLKITFSNINNYNCIFEEFQTNSFHRHKSLISKFFKYIIELSKFSAILLYIYFYKFQCFCYVLRNETDFFYGIMSNLFNLTIYYKITVI